MTPSALLRQLRNLPAPVTHGLALSLAGGATGAGTEYLRHREDEDPEQRRKAVLRGAGAGALTGALLGVTLGTLRNRSVKPPPAPPKPSDPFAKMYEAMDKEGAVYTLKRAVDDRTPSRMAGTHVRGFRFAPVAEDISKDVALHQIFDAHDRKPAETGNESSQSTTFQEGITG